MRSTLVLLALAGACGSATASAPTPGAPPYPPGSLPALRAPGPLSPRIASYHIDARLDAAARRISATQTLVWKHTGHQPVASLPFHLYMNAFEDENSVFMRESRGVHRGQKAGAGKWGSIEVSSIKLGETELRPGAHFGEDETTLDVPLPAPLAPGSEVTLSFTFTTQLPQVFARTGYLGDFIMVGQWFPKIGVLVSSGTGAGGAATQEWHCDTFHLNSEFFADFGSYDVSLDVPAELVIAATGVLVKVEDAPAGRRRLAYHAEDVHDFAWMADPRMRVAQTVTKEGVRILLYHRPEQERFAARHLEAARRTVETFSRLFYPYPWSVLTVIDPPPAADQAAGGMEYPTLVTTGGDRVYAPPGVRYPEFVTVHEVGHNWFQGLLASNEVDEAWLDEGVNEYADGIVVDEWFGADASAMGWGGLRLGVYEAERLMTAPDDDVVPIATRSYEFPSYGAYADESYGRTALALKTLENLVGRDRFLAALGAYAHAWAFKHPAGADLFAALDAALGEDTSWFTGPAFHSPGAVALQVADISPHKQPDGKTWVSDVLLLNTGSVPARVDVRLRLADGSERRERWDDVTLAPARWKWTRLTTSAPSPVVEVEIDPEHRILLEGERMNNALRLIGDSSASWRAGARAGFWEQSILQLVGF